MAFATDFGRGALPETGAFRRFALWHNRTHARYSWSTPPWVRPLGVSNAVRSEAGLVNTTAELHHWLIPDRARFVPNYIRHARWNLFTTETRAAHAMVDTAFTATGVVPYPLVVRPFMAMPGWARGATLSGTGVDEVAEDLIRPYLR